eukprot:60818-Hanusia_phi.AAC.1
MGNLPSPQEVQVEGLLGRSRRDDGDNTLLADGACVGEVSGGVENAGVRPGGRGEGQASQALRC